MEDTLKRLLAAEQEANRITEEAGRCAEEMVSEAQLDARKQKERFRARLPELRSAFIDKAEQHAAQSLKEIQRRYDERLEQLRLAAEANENAALEEAFTALLDTQEAPS